ncbi:mobile mystery protein B [Oleispirillum naphthae]|uniref:mobile mystery protein B n=1 Tax=Oleispirillum naphthae TaxID=2838853 RepID=UPI0030824D7E
MDEPDGATPLDPDELAGLRHRHVTTRGQLDRLEQANIQEALAWLPRRRKGGVLTRDFVAALHRRMFGQVWRWAGSFRRSDKNTGVAHEQIEEQLRMLLGDVLYWVENGTFSPMEIAVRFHHRLVSIHPFPNGNGRHARIIADVLLTECFGLPGIDWAGGQGLQAMTGRRTQYITALRAADLGDYAPLLAFAGVPDAG